jgi:hypothetical protein
MEIRDDQEGQASQANAKKVTQATASSVKGGRKAAVDYF